MLRTSTLASLSLLLITAAVAAGCAGPVLERAESIDLSPIVQSRNLRGVSLSEGQNLDVVVEGLGIVTVTREGELVQIREPGQRGLLDLSYNDLASEGDEIFVLLADNEGYLYDAKSERQTVHFCVEPGWEPEPNGPVFSQKNDAVALSGNLIIAAPRFYEDAQLTESALRTYQAHDGAPIDSIDLTGLGLELKGIARSASAMYGVQQDALHRFDLDGAHQGELQLADVQSASGIAVDEDAGLMFVTDEDTAKIAVFPL